MPKLRGSQKILFRSFRVFIAANSISVALAKEAETIAFSLSSRFLSKPKTLFTISLPRHHRLT
jgi:hypothetical protein